jgi:hypothetical protein
MALTNPTTQEHVVLGDVRKDGENSYSCTPRFYETKADRDYEKANGRMPTYKVYVTRDASGNVVSGEPTSRVVVLTKEEYLDAITEASTIDAGIVKALYLKLKQGEFTGFIDE